MNELQLKHLWILLLSKWRLDKKWLKMEQKYHECLY